VTPCCSYWGPAFIHVKPLAFTYYCFCIIIANVNTVKGKWHLNVATKAFLILCSMEMDSPNTRSPCPFLRSAVLDKAV
jgi:hypothetical protein